MKNTLYVPGFLVGVTKAGIKGFEKEDMALIYSETPAVVAGTFTKNQVKAAPVILTAHRVKSGLAQAIIVNSGNANACTGLQGERDAKEMTALVAKGLNIPEQLVLICSTGVIGQPLPMDKIRKGVDRLLKKLTPTGWKEAAKAIMTTDTFPKLVYKEGRIKGIPFRLLGIAKGAGMIRPDMATMLAFFVTDIAISPTLLQPLFKEVVSVSFNRISVDGDTSTNDTALILANGRAQNPGKTREDFTPFATCLYEAATELARMIAKDGEGASKLIEIVVQGAKSIKEADQIAMTVANSPLVKTAIYGEDANWGRIMAAIGRAGVEIDPEKIDIYFGNICVVKNGLGQGEKAEKEVHVYLKKKEVLLKIDLKLGKATTTWYTCDLTEEYIHINAAYRT
jgi:glutamate N-acetyltransferase/amino-acid N-acetyltransferase